MLHATYAQVAVNQNQMPYLSRVMIRLNAKDNEHKLLSILQTHT